MQVKRHKAVEAKIMEIIKIKLGRIIRIAMKKRKITIIIRITQHETICRNITVGLRSIY